MYDVLYYYSSSVFCIVEIKRLNLPATAPKDQIYHWLKIDLSSDAVQRLTFQAMDADSRSFKEGYLDLKGAFKTSGGTTLLDYRESRKLDQKVEEAIIKYLS